MSLSNLPKNQPLKDISYVSAQRELERIGNFAGGSNSQESGNGIDQWNNTLVFSIVNPTTTKQQVNLFGFTGNLFQPPAAINPPPSVIQPVLSPVGLGPKDAAFCPSNNFVYTADPISNTIEVIDTATNTVFATIPAPVGFNPNTIAYNPTNNQMYVGSSALAQVIRIDCATNLVVGAPIVIAAPTNAQAIAYNSVMNTMWVGGAIGAVDVINCFTNLSVASFIPVGAASSVGVAINPNLNRAYVTDIVTNSVFVIDCTNNTTIVAVPVVGLVGLRDIVFCSSNSSVYMVGFVSNNVRPLNTITNVLGPIIAVGVLNPADICYNPINNILYVVKQGTNDFVTINPATNVVTGAVALAMTVSAIAVYNSNANAVVFLANGGGFGEYQAFNPAVPPQATVIINGNFTLGDLFNDFLGKPAILKGLRMLTDNFNQFGNNLFIQYITITGKIDSVQFQPLMYISPSNRNANVIDVRSEFGIDVKPPDTNLIFDVEPLTSLVLSLKMTRAVDNTVPLTTDKDISKDFGAGTDDTKAINMTGNPIFDNAMMKQANEILSESGYNSLIQYAFYPRETGNPVVDAALLNAAGFEDDH